MVLADSFMWLSLDGVGHLEFDGCGFCLVWTVLQGVVTLSLSGVCLCFSIVFWSLFWGI